MARFDERDRLPEILPDVAPAPTHLLHCRSLETGQEAIVATRPYRLSSTERWSWVAGDVVNDRRGPRRRKSA